MTALVWFRRDLRLRDNPALTAAVKSGLPVIAAYIWSPEDSRPWSPGAASRWYLHQSLLSLQHELAGKGITLKLSSGASLPILMELVSRYHVEEIYWNNIYETSQLELDQRVFTVASEAGIPCYSFHDHCLFPPGSIKNRNQQPYKVFTPFWRQISTQLIDQSETGQTAAFSLPNHNKLNEKADLVDDLGLLDNTDWHHKLHNHWQAGEPAALTILMRFLTKIEGYYEGRDFPDRNATSCLSASLHFGEISPRRIVHQILPFFRGEKGANAAGAAESYLRQLGWREFAIHLLNAFPQSVDSSFKPQFETAAIWHYDPEQLALWKQGKTGIPLVDAGMRQLWETGWMHNRVRMVAASVLTKNMGQHWIHGSRWFWDTLVDADLGNNTMGWQWVAGCGCDAAPYFRIFNPDTQAKRFDPKGRYISQWNKSNTLGSPSIDLKTSRKAALERYASLSKVRNEKRKP